MRARLRRILAAAAMLVAGGAPIVAALLEANRNDAEPITCGDWRGALAEFEGEEREFFLAVTSEWLAADGNPPKAYGDWLLGDCGGGRCVVETPCGESYSYAFEASREVAGTRLIRFVAHPYFAGGWRAVAQGESNAMRFWSVRKAVAQSCQSTQGLTPAYCRALLASLDDCWDRKDGHQCRNGMLYGPGLGGVDADGNPVACTPRAQDDWVGCSDGARGPGWSMREKGKDAPAVLDLEVNE